MLTTHYIEEAEEMADRIGIMSRGELLLVEDKTALMNKLGRKQLVMHLGVTLDAKHCDTATLSRHALELANEGRDLVYTYDFAQRAPQA